MTIKRPQDLYLDKEKRGNKIATALFPYIKIGPDDNSMIPTEEYTRLTSKEKILVFLFYKEMLKELGAIDESDLPSVAKRISKETGVNYNTVRPYLVELKKAGKLKTKKKEEGKGYFISYIGTDSLLNLIKTAEVDGEEAVPPKKKTKLNHKKLSLKEFISKKKPRNDVDKTIIIGFYLENYDSLKNFNIDDIREGLYRAREKKPSNINDKLNLAKKRGMVLEAKKKKNGKKAWMLTNEGEKYVKNLPRQN